ncbi:ABC transporter permease [Leekyejoonella antrihumi]|uniref:ABC transporter permease n=1 Tax=Leekyejoonella antrihumi TaxID=1660198 RepID=A0A563DXB4_9MICO|nr:ABC transporter permease [Leekyejoonella antrihumi]TWP34900.1 ABC transporter permease [Leekyejoonella antrihumi]
MPISDLKSDEGGLVEVQGSGKVIEGKSPMQLAMTRLRKDRTSMIALAVVIILLLIAILAPILDWVGILDPLSIHNSGPGNLVSGIGSVPTGPLGGISWQHPLGVEPGTGRDLLSRLLEGVTWSMIISISATIIAIVTGTVLGIISGFTGGKVDFFLGRFIDLILCFPQTLMLLALSGTFIAWITLVGVPSGNPSTGVYVILIMGAFGWPGYARIIRGLVLSMRNREFVEAARSLGSNRRRIYFTELLPNLWPPILIYSTLQLPAYVSTEAALSYLGVGIQAPTPTLGNILTDSVNYSQADPTYFFLPALAIAIIVLAFNLVGDGLGDALDPRHGR